MDIKPKEISKVLNDLSNVYASALEGPVQVHT